MEFSFFHFAGISILAVNNGYIRCNYYTMC
jgi:hypothetical protein